MAASLEHSYISADSHVVEPADLWLTRMDKRFRDRAPRVESRPKGDYYLIDGLPPMPHSGMEGAMMEEKIAKGKIEKLMGRRHGETRPGAWDAQARLVDQNLDNIGAEVMYPGVFGLQFSLTPDPEYQRECIRVYNDWLSELAAAAPQRLLGTGLLPM
ncbi:MAG: amidohydrolase family protein, partial [Candidatus Binatia bacterium]